MGRVKSYYHDQISQMESDWNGEYPGEEEWYAQQDADKDWIEQQESNQEEQENGNHGN